MPCSRSARSDSSDSKQPLISLRPSQNYTRHHVKGVDYPAVVPARLGEQVMGRALTDDEASVRGCVVKGLTAADLRFLDTFEGDVSRRSSTKKLD